MSTSCGYVPLAPSICLHYSIVSENHTNAAQRPYVIKFPPAHVHSPTLQSQSPAHPPKSYMITFPPAPNPTPSTHASDSATTTTFLEKQAQQQQTTLTKLQHQHQISQQSIAAR